VSITTRLDTGHFNVDIVVDVEKRSRIPGPLKVESVHKVKWTLNMKDVTSSSNMRRTSPSVILVAPKSSSSPSASLSSPPLSFDSDLPRLLSDPERSEVVLDDSSLASIAVGLVGFALGFPFVDFEPSTE